MNKLLPLAALLLSMGCASNPGDDDVEGSVTLVCTEEKELGSYIKKRKCRSIKQIERERRDASESLRSPTVNPDGTRSG